MALPRQPVLPDSLRLAVEFQAAEAYPLEVDGDIVRIDSRPPLYLALICTHYFKRTASTVSRGETFTSIAESMFDTDESSIIGGFHAHPCATPVASRRRDYARKKDQELTDEANIHDGCYELITSVWPTWQGSGWRFRHALYIRDGAVLRIAGTLE